MDSSELNDRVSELERSAGGDKSPHGKVLPVKIRVRCGNQVQVIDLEPSMLSAKGWGSEPEPAVLLIDLS